MVRRFWRYIALVGILLARLSLPGVAQPAPVPSPSVPPPGDPLLQRPVVEALRSGRVLMNYENLDLKVLARIMAELTGRNVVLDDGVNGKVTVLSAREVTPDEAWDIFKAALLRAGFAVREKPGFAQVVPIVDARREGSLVRNPRGVPRSDMSLGILVMKDGDATAIQNAVRPFVSDPNNLQAYGPGRALLIMDRSETVARIAELVRSLDKATDSLSISVLFPQYAEAEKMAPILQNVLTRTAPDPSRQPPKVVAFAPTNSLLVQGTKEQIQEVKAILKRLDIPRSAPDTVQKPRYFVYKLQNGQAEDAAKILESMLAERKALIQQELQQNPSRVPGGQAAAAPAGGNTTTAAPAVVDAGSTGVGGNQRIPYVSAKVSADKETNSIIVFVSPNEYPSIKTLLEQLDRPRRQVLVTAMVAEVGLQELYEQSARLQGLTPNGAIVSFQGGATEEGLLSFLSSGNFVIGTGGGSTRTINVNGRDVQVPTFFAFLSANKQNRDFNLLSSPRLLTADHKKATMKVGNVVPFATGARFSSIGQPTVTYDYKDVGIKLEFTPHISQSDSIRIELDQQIQEVTDFLQQNLGGFGYIVPLISNRSVKTSISLKDGETVVIGGLISKRTTETLKKVPILGDIPLIQLFFRDLRKEDRKTTLFVALTPHIIDTPEDIARVDRAYQRFLTGDPNPGDDESVTYRTKHSPHIVDDPYGQDPDVGAPNLELRDLEMQLPEPGDALRQPRITVKNGRGTVEFVLVGTVRLPDGSVEEYRSNPVRLNPGQTRQVDLPPYQFPSQQGVYEFDMAAVVDNRVVARLPLPKRLNVK